MISLENVEQSILELENKDTSFATCERLAWLYIVRDHLKTYEVTENVLSVSGKSDFLQAINGMNPDKVFPVIDELVDAVKTLHPKMYDKFIEKLKD